MMMAMMIHYARTLQSTPLVPTSSNRFNSNNINGDGDDNDGSDWITFTTYNQSPTYSKKTISTMMMMMT